MTKGAAAPVYGKNLEQVLSRTRSPIAKLYKIYINDDPGLTLIYLRLGQLMRKVTFYGQSEKKLKICLFTFFS